MHIVPSRKARKSRAELAIHVYDKVALYYTRTVLCRLCVSSQRGPHFQAVECLNQLRKFTFFGPFPFWVRRRYRIWKAIPKRQQKVRVRHSLIN